MLKVAQLSVSLCGKLRLKQALGGDLSGLVFITAIPPFIMNTLEKKAFLKVRSITLSFVSPFVSFSFFSEAGFLYTVLTVPELIM